MPEQYQSTSPDAASRATSILYVDDDDRLRDLLFQILRADGYLVELAATVSDALRLLNARTFDVVLSDLNIGEPSDGFTVISAARRIHPQTVTLIITGFPDFQGALDAIRRHADDYLIKPVAPPYLLHTLHEKLTNRERREPAIKKRVAQVLREQKEFVVAQWCEAVRSQPDFAGVPLSERERPGVIYELLDEVILAMETGSPELSLLEDLSASGRSAAESHGKLRRRQGYTIRMLLREARILQREIYRLEQSHLLEIDISYLIPDMIRATDTLEALMTDAVSTYLIQ